MRSARFSLDRALSAGLLLFGASLALSKSAGNVLLLLLFATTVIGVVCNKDFRGRIRRSGGRPLTAAFAIFSFVALAGVLYTENPADGLQVAFKILSLPVIYVLVAAIIQSSPDEDAGTRRAERLLVSFLAGLTVLNALGLMAYLGLIGDRAFVLPLVPLHLHHIWFSNINALGLYTAAALLLYSPRGRSAGVQLLLCGFLLLCVFCVLLALSRTAWFSTILTLSVLTFFVIRSRKTVLALGVVLALAGILAYRFVPLVHDRIDLIARETAQFSAGEHDTSIGNRFLMWEAALMMFRSQPLFGVGTGDFPSTMSGYIQSDVFPEFLLEFNQPHNMYLFAMATNGMVGLLALLSVFSCSVGFAAPRLRADGGDKLFAFLALATAVHFMLAGLTDSFFNIQMLRYAFAFIMGVCVRYSVYPASGGRP